MNDNQEPKQDGINPQNKQGEDPSTDTTDVRDAIERAKEHVQAEEQLAQVSHQPLTPEQHADVNTVGMQVAAPSEMPSAASTDGQQSSASQVLPGQEQQFTAQQVVPQQQVPVHQQVNIPADHPMAPLYIQQPMPPTLKANRLAGVLISLLATVAFALVYAGILAIIRAQYFPPSTFLQEGLLPYLTSLGFVFPTVTFFIMMVILVLIFNRAGWWVYAVLGIVVAVIVWGAAGAGYSLSPQLFDGADAVTDSDKRFDIAHMATFAITLPAVLAAFVAREVTVWFGAWIGSRGRLVKQKNAEAMQEYEQKLAEVQAQVS
ncbi:MAG TPA: hypothetical protein VLZ31_04090 [Microbacteriaceae bacterium]|nr:hypothetical protein [Microbacteriaceae bacterium]